MVVAMGNVFIPRGASLLIVLVWALGISVLFLVGAVAQSSAFAAHECLGMASACIGQRESFWFWATVKTAGIALVLFAVVLPILVQAAIRAVARLIARRRGIGRLAQRFE